MIIDNVKSFVLTEKSARLIEQDNRYTFNVDPRLTKPQIRKFVEKVFNVKVIAVNTHKPPRKKRRLGSSQGYKTQYKRAIVTLHKKDSIQVFASN
uniref:ribosomal protein L23 n=1 Tax=Tetraselmis marina TaxID=41888 RepID=UPI0021ABD26E|nr:ribosomal protein L23 [Tetraselmis marina]UUA64539.1 ribosomal protein L23 [Tetraselmis marina]